MRQYGESFKPLVDPTTGRAIPNSPLVSLDKGANGPSIVFLQPLNTPPAPRDEQTSAKDPDN